MTYFSFLLIFLGIPLAGVALLTWRDQKKQVFLPGILQGAPFWAVLLGHVFVAVVYTTPWDNYLVATGVWYYNPALVTGITLGWVPIEEYTFFVLQTLLTGLWLGWLLKRLPAAGEIAVNGRLMRWISVTVFGFIWIFSVVGLALDWQEGTYLCIILAWALPPIMLQFGFGLDILWRFRAAVIASLVSAVTYLVIADSVAIASGTWTIDPGQSLEVFLWGVLPLEEFIFFFVTNALIVFGMTLVLASASHVRYGQLKDKLRSVLNTAHKSEGVS